MAARYAANKQIHWKKSEAAFRGILDRVDSAAGRLVKSEKLILDKVEYKIHIFQSYGMNIPSSVDRVTVEGFVQTMEKHGIEVTILLGNVYNAIVR